MGVEPGDSVVLAPRRDIYELMGEVPKGRLQTLAILCDKLASRHGADY